jgi:hypothetical protein
LGVAPSSSGCSITHVLRAIASVVVFDAFALHRIYALASLAGADATVARGFILDRRVSANPVWGLAHGGGALVSVAETGDTSARDAPSALFEVISAALDEVFYETVTRRKEVVAPVENALGTQAIAGRAILRDPSLDNALRSRRPCRSQRAFPG